MLNTCLLHFRQKNDMSKDTKDLSRNGVGCLTSLESKGCAAAMRGLSLEKRLYWFFEGPGSQAEKCALHMVGSGEP